MWVQMHSCLDWVSQQELGSPHSFVRYICSGHGYNMCYGDLATRFWLGVRDADYGCPELYMYSTGDDLTDATRIEALILDRRATSKHAIYEMKVDYAPHVKIMLRYPHEYMAQLAAVLD